MKIANNKLFFTSDLHFWHSNIIGFCGRPFIDLKEMHYKIIDNWNETVEHDDHIFILGDFMMSSSVEHSKELLGRLMGYKHLILGNHDYQNKLDRNVFRDLFESVHDYLDLRVEDEEMPDKIQRIFLCHYPMMAWAGKSVGAWHFYGHMHSTPGNVFKHPDIKALEVGTDLHGYTPISYHKAKSIIAKRKLNYENH